MSADEVKAGDEGSREGRAPTDEERAETYRQQLKQLHVVDLVRDMMVTLVTVGYEKLGLTEQTRELRNLDDARVAIEALRRLIEVVEGGDPEDASLRSTLAQMQLNFARVANTEVPAPARPPRVPSEADSQPRVESEPEPAITPNPPTAEVAETPSPRKAPDKTPAARKPAATKPTARKTAATKPAPKKTAAKEMPAKKAPAKKAPPKKAAAESSARKPARPKAAGGDKDKAAGENEG
jgi:hypothetical protein